VISGYNGEAESIADACIGYGISPGRIVLEPQARHTEENVRYSLALLDAYSGIRTVGCLCKNYASLRCRLTFERYRRHKAYRFFMVNFFEEPLKHFHRNPLFTRKLTDELKKVIDYSARGWIVSMAPELPYTLHELRQLCDLLQSESAHLPMVEPSTLPASRKT
jgi:hypothetical protein